MINIDKETYKVTNDNFYKTAKYKKNQIILAGSLRKKNFHIKRFSKKDGGKSKKWPTYSISREGNIFQHYDPKYYSDFMENKDIDRHSISIVLENMGVLYYDYTSKKYLNWILEECEENNIEKNIFEKNWKGCRYWENYTAKQFDATINLCKFLCKKFEIPLKSLGFNVFFNESSKFNGIVTRSNFDISCNDLNPSFNFRLFSNLLTIKDD